jgi:hypothetical protein
MAENIDAPIETSQTTVDDPIVPKKKPLTYEEASAKLDNAMRSSSQFYDTGFLEQKRVPYEKTAKYIDQDYGYIHGADNEDFYAKQQSWYTEIPKAVLKFPALVLAKTGAGVGFTLGLINPVNWFDEDGYIAAASDNAMANAFSSLEDTIKQEWGPTFQEAADTKKGFFARAFTDLNFWTEDVVDGAAFMASAFIPGMALSKLGGGMKFAQALSKLKIGATDDVVQGLSTAQNYLTNAQKIAKGFDGFTTWATATASEAMFEAKEVKDHVMESLSGQLNPETGQEYTEEEKREIAGGAAKNTFLMNAALLGFTNAIQMKYLYKALGMTEPGVNKIAQKALGDTFEAVVPTTRVGKFLASKTGSFAKGAGAGIITEGYVEENAQLAISRMNQEYGSLGKVASFSDYGDAFKKWGSQTIDALMGNDPEAAMNIGLGGLLGGGMSGYGNVREANRERLTTTAAIDMLNKAQTNWLKFGDIYETEVDEASGKATIKKDAQGNLKINEEKLAAALTGLGRNLSATEMAEAIEDPNQQSYLRSLAFRDFVQAHVEAGIAQDALFEKLDKYGNLQPADLAKMGFSTNQLGNVSNLKDLAASFIQQNELIKADILETSDRATEQARKATLVSLATQQTIINKIAEQTNTQAEKIKTGLINFAQSSLSDSSVDNVNLLTYRIQAQERMIKDLKSDPLQSSFQLKAAESLLKELQTEKAKLIKDNEISLEGIKTDPDGLYIYDKVERSTDPLNASYQRKLREKAAYLNVARHQGLQFALLADTKNGVKNFLEHMQQDVVDPFNAMTDDEIANAMDEYDGPKESTEILMSGETEPITITEGEEYITAADETKRIFRGQVAKTYNHNLIRILKIEDDKITIRINNNKSYIVSKDQFATAGKIWNLNSMSLDSKIYFKNRDLLFDLNVKTISGKPHNNSGEHATRDYSKAGVNVKARFILVKEDDKQVLKVTYLNPKTKKKEVVNYDAAYLKKYAANKIDLRGLPTELEELAKQTEARLKRNLEDQIKIFTERAEEAEAKLAQAKIDKQTNEDKFVELRQQLMDDRAHLQLAIEEVNKYDGKKGRKSKVQLELVKLVMDLSKSIANAQIQIDALKAERSALETLYKDLEHAKRLYEDTALDLEISETPFDRQGSDNLSTTTEEELRDLRRNQTTRKLSTEAIDSLLKDTQDEVNTLTDRINTLSAYVRDIKDVLKTLTTITDFLAFQDLPTTVTTRSGLRDFVRQKIAEAKTKEQKEEWQALMNQILKGGKPASDILFFVSTLRDSLNELDGLKAKLDVLLPKAERLAQAQEDRVNISTLEQRVEYLKFVQQVLTEDRAKVRTAPTVAPSPKKIVGQDGFGSDIAIEDNDAPTFDGPKKPKFEITGLNKTFGSQFQDVDNTIPNTNDGIDRFYAFTASQNVQGKGYELEVITAANDNFGPDKIRREDINPDDIKVVLVRRTEIEETEISGNESASTKKVEYIGSNGEVLENPTKENIIYTSLANINTLDVARVRNEYTVDKDTTDQEIQEAIDNYKAWVKSVVESGETKYLKAVNTSPGIERVERLTSIDEDGKYPIAKAELEGRVIEDDPDWLDLKSANNPDVHIELRVATAKNAIATGILPGRAVMQEFTYDGGGNKIWGDKVIRVFNRELTVEEKDLVIKSLLRLTDLFGRQNTTDPALKLNAQEQAEYNLIMNYLRGILAWGSPSEAAPVSSKFFFIENGLNRGALKIPFTAQSIAQMKDRLLEGVFHHINNRALQENTEFDTITFDENGKAVPDKSYTNYTQYLLEKREDGIPPVYTSLPRVDSGIPQRINSYINWLDSNGEPIPGIKPKVKAQEKPVTTESTTAAPTVGKNILELVNDFLNYESHSVTIGSAKEPFTLNWIKAEGGVKLQLTNKAGVKKSPSKVYTSAEEIKADRANISLGIKEATGFNPDGVLGSLFAFGKNTAEPAVAPAPVAAASPTTQQSIVVDVAYPIENKPLTVNGPVGKEAVPIIDYTLGPKELFETVKIKIVASTADTITAQISYSDTKAFTETFDRTDFENKVFKLGSAPVATTVAAAKVLEQNTAPVVTPPVDSEVMLDKDGDPMYFGINEAAEKAVHKGGMLRGKVYTKNVTTGEIKLLLEAEVAIPVGNLPAARTLLKRALYDKIPHDNGGVFRLAINEVKELEDFKALDKFMRANLPQISVHKTAHLISGKAWGQFLRGAVYIYENAEIGTGFHEAFEAVWASFLSDNEQQELIEEFRNREGAFYNPFTRRTKNHSEATEADAREMMAEEFRAHVLQDRNKPTTDKIKKFFKDLWNYIKNLLGLSKIERTELDSKINKVFKKIKGGSYRKATPITERSSASPIYRAIPGLTQEETAAILEGLRYYFFSELFKDGKTISNILNGLQPVESNALLNNLFNNAFDTVVANSVIAGADQAIKVQASKKETYKEFKDYIQKFGVNFEDNVFNIEEQATDTLGIRDSISIDPRKMSSVNVKLLISSLPFTEYNNAGDIKLTWKFNQPRLVDYDKVHTLLLNELSNIVSYVGEDGVKKNSLDLMFQKLDKKYINNRGYYVPGYVWIHTLKTRLKYIDGLGNTIPIEALTEDDIALRVSFIKSFTNAKTIPAKTIVDEEGFIHDQNPVSNVNTRRVREQWGNNIKSSIISGGTNMLMIDPSGQIILNRDSAEYKSFIGILNKPNELDLNTVLDALVKLGITFTASRADLKKHEKTLRENLVQIAGLVKSETVSSIQELYGTNTIGGRINTLLNIQSEFSGEENILSYINAKGESQYSVGIPSLLSNTINLLNSVSSIEELLASAPWLGTGDQLNAYQTGSELLKKGGLLFNNKGKRREGALVEHYVISGMGTTDYEGTTSADLQFPERVANKIHYLLKNIVFSNINSDKNTEFGIGLPGNPLVSISAIQNLLFFDRPNNITDLYVNHLADELHAAVEQKNNPLYVEFYTDQVQSLGHFRDVMGTDFIDKFKLEVLSDKSIYSGPKAVNDFITANKVQINKVITNYLKNKAKETAEWLVDLDIFTQPRVESNLFLTDAIDNEGLRNMLKLVTEQKVTLAHSGGVAIQRDGFTQNDIETLAAYLAFNEEVLIAEQHKLLYGHPTFYKDLPKRANGATSTKEQIVEDSDIIAWLDNNMARNDGKIRSSEVQQTMKSISFKDPIVVSLYHKDIVEGIYADMMTSSRSKASAEKEIGARFDDKGELASYIYDSKGNPTGIVKAYTQLEEANAMAWGMPDAIRDILFLTSKLTKTQEAQWNYEIAYEKLALSKKKYAPKYLKEELAIAEEIVAKGDPGYIFQVLKPQYFGPVENAGVTQPNFLKHALQPKFYRHVEGTQYENLYLASKKAQIDIIGFSTGHKVGNNTTSTGEFVDLYNSKGEINIGSSRKGYELPKDLPIQKIYSRFYGIQVETSNKAKNSVVRGTQVTKLIMLNAYDNGVPISEDVHKLITEYNDTLVSMFKLSKKELLKELGLELVDGKYKTKDLRKLVETLRKEAISRDLSDNMIAGIEAQLQHDGSYRLKYRFDTLVNREKIDNILNSIVDSRVISEKMSGKSAVQVPSTLYETNPRDFVYLKDGVYIPMPKTKKAQDALSAEELGSVTMHSSDLKFYRNEKGVTTAMEVYIAWPFKGITPESVGLVLVNGIYQAKNGRIDNELLKALGFRIPTQAMNSIENIIIKGFTPATNGDMIVVPSEIVGKAGSDFDIDKINLYLANFEYNADENRIEYMPLLTDNNSSVSQRYATYIRDNVSDLRSILRDMRHSQEYLDNKADIDYVFSIVDQQREEAELTKLDVETVYAMGYEIFSNLPLAVKQQFWDYEAALRRNNIEGLEKLAAYSNFTNQWKAEFASGQAIQLEETRKDRKTGKQTIEIVTITPAQVNVIFDQLLSNYEETAEYIGLSIEQFNNIAVLFGKAKDHKTYVNSKFRSEVNAVIAEALGLLSESEFGKLPIKSQNSKKALQNHLISTMINILAHSSNYRQLVLPNGTDRIKSLATRITELKIAAGTISKENEKSYNYLRTFIGNSKIRERYLTAKRMVGIAAVHNTLHSMAQVSGLKLEGTYKTGGIWYFANGEETRKINIKLDHHPALENGEYNIGHRYDVDGNLISDRMSEKLTGFVDGAKDPFVFDLNINMNTAGVWFYLDHLGVSEEEIAYMFNQPIMDQYFAEFANNKSAFKRINSTNLNREAMFYKIAAPYYLKATGVDVLAEIRKYPDNKEMQKIIKRRFVEGVNEIANKFASFSPKELENSIFEGADKADPKLQTAVLMSYLEYEAQGFLLSNFMQAIGYDNKRTRTIQENQLQASKWKKSLADGFISNPEKILSNTFIGELKLQKEDVLNMFSNFFVTLTPGVQKVFKPLIDKLDNPDFFAKNEDKIQLLDRYQNFIISYILHTTKFIDKDNNNVSINQFYKELMMGGNSLAKALHKLKIDDDLEISENLVVRELLPLINSDVTKVDNISLFRNKIDTFEVNKMIEALDDLKQHALQTGNKLLDDFVTNLAMFTIMQSGQQPGPLDYRKILSTELYSDLVNNILGYFDYHYGGELDTEKVWDAFHRNNWNIPAVVPRAPNWLKLRRGALSIGDGWGMSIHDYILKTTKKPGLSSKEVSNLVKQDRGNEAFDRILFKKSYLNTKGFWQYLPINKWGDGPRMTEIHDTEQPSILTKNGDVNSLGAVIDSGGWISAAQLLGLPDPNVSSMDLDAQADVGDFDPIDEVIKKKEDESKDCNKK